MVAASMPVAWLSTVMTSAWCGDSSDKSREERSERDGELHDAN